MNINLLSLLFFFSLPSFAVNQKFYQTVWKNLTSTKSIAVTDTISKNPVNTTILIAFSHDKILGYIREIKTTTGCDSACLPLEYTSFYSPEGNFIGIRSKKGLTKINHTPFTSEDYSQLEFLLSLPLKEFNHIKHPKELTDALSGETLKKYSRIVVRGAAYSTLRIHLYHQDTLKKIKKLINKK